MSSTEQERLLGELRAFFDTRLLSLAGSGRSDTDTGTDTDTATGSPGRGYFPLRPTAGQDSYYVRRDARAADPAAGMGEIDYHDEASLAAALRALWERQGNDELAALAGELAALAWRCGEAERGQEQQAEVSPFIYVMF